MTLQGLCIVSLFHLLHECVHDTVFVPRWANRLLAFVCGFVLFLPSIWFRHFHFAHHRYTQQPGKDPELDAAKPETRRGWLLHVSGIPVWLSQWRLLVRSVVKPSNEPYIPESDRQSVRLEMWLMLLGYSLLFVVSVTMQSWMLVYVWLVPAILGQPFLRLYLLAEHAGCESGSSNMFFNTRTVLSNPVLRWFTWNMPFHTEHHVYPTVPFHQLPRLHQMMKAHVATLEPGYVVFNVDFFRLMNR